MFIKIDHIEIVTENLQRCMDFYINSLGFNIINRYKITSRYFSETVLLAHNQIHIELLAAREGQYSQKQNKPLGLRLSAYSLQL